MSDATDAMEQWMVQYYIHHSLFNIDVTTTIYTAATFFQNVFLSGAKKKKDWKWRLRKKETGRWTWKTKEMPSRAKWKMMMNQNDDCDKIRSN